MTKRKTGVKLLPKEVRHGRQYPGVSEKIVDWADHKFEEGILYIRVRFIDKTAKHHFLMLEEADLSAWKGGHFRRLRVFARDEKRLGITREFLEHEN